MTIKTAFIGLGVMGYPMAGHLSKAGFEVCVYNRTRARAEQWVEQYPGRVADTPGRATVGSDLVFICVGQDDDVRQVCYGPEGVLEAMTAGSLLVDHTTASATLARELNQACVEKGVGFVDAPVSGGQQGAENGRLTVMCGGDEAVFERAKPVIDCYAQMVKRVGPAGAGQLCKMVNQICIAGVVQGLAEGLHFAQQAGLDGTEVVSVIAKGAAQSWQMENRHQTMLAGEYNHGFAVDWMRKDLAMVLSEARDNGARLPLVALVDQFYADVQANGGGRWDTSSLLTRLTADTKD
ncbi:MAG TPA: oxidoreductase [Porticoccaceae bacterium]|nr:oxidoreductase [Porticoccaceae bacterium]